jgi:hypothetical protein
MEQKGKLVAQTASGRRMSMPFFCYNKNDYCDHSENCEDCGVWAIGKGGKQVPSNADRIRAMSDEELAVFLRTVEYDVEQFPFVQDWDKWLKEPAEGE